MNRTRLQQLVREAAYGTHTVATEGFLGEAIDKIKSGFAGSTGNKILTAEEIKRDRIDVQSAINRLHETVLNASWLSKAELVTGTITDKWAVPGLDYNATLNPDKPTAHLKTAFTEYLNTVKAYSKIVKEYSQAGQKLYSALLKSLVKTDGNKQAVLQVLEDTDEKFAKILPPFKHMETHPITMIGNASYVYKDGKVTRSEKTCAAVNLPKLDKVQIVEIAKLVTQFLEQDPNDLIDSSQDFVDWDAIGHDLKQAGATKDVVEKILEELTASTFLNAFEYQNAWDDKAVSLLHKGIGDITIRCLQWINASIK